MNRLQEKYKNVVVPQMMKDFEYKSVMEVPHVEKVVINIDTRILDVNEMVNAKFQLK